MGHHAMAVPRATTRPNSAVHTCRLGKFVVGPNLHAIRIDRLFTPKTVARFARREKWGGDMLGRRVLEPFVL